MKYKLVAFDVDGTLVDELQYIWVLIHNEIGVDLGKVNEMTEKYYKKEISYKEWADHDIQLWVEKGVTKKELMDIINKLKLMNGAIETLEELKKKGYKLAVISGGLDIVLDYFIPDAEKIFDHILIDKLVFDEDGKLTGGLVPEEFDDIENKADILEKLAKKEGVSLDECVFVGDSDNDVEVMKAAGLAIGFNPTKKIEKISDVVIKKKDLREILKYL